MVARDLVGTILVSELGSHAVEIRVREVEAYLGPGDRACHTWGGRRTRRVASMWGPAGRAYVYLIYGLHHCLNVVTGGPGEAVLIRGGAVLSGLDAVRSRRGPRAADRDLVNGPGKLSQALAVTIDHDGLDLTDPSSPVRILRDDWSVERGMIRQTARIGVESAGAAASWKLRWVLDPLATRSL